MKPDRISLISWTEFIEWGGFSRHSDQPHVTVALECVDNSMLLMIFIAHCWL